MTARWDRIELNFTGEPPGEMLRLVTFLGHHDSRVYLAPWAYIEVGAGSLLAARQV